MDTEARYEGVKAWQEKVVIPTYGVGEPEKNPIFLEKRVYQGSSGSVYPHPVIEKIKDQKEDKEWLALFLENKYVKIMILPELGGRVQMAYDKIKNRHFVYYNQVIKPALVGLTGPWISGGIEFNWPQHHRPSTYEPVDFCIEENPDGSQTVWCSEVERMFRTKGMAGFTLHPDKAYLEIKVKLYNRTSQPQTFLWWANPAVKVNDDYQSVFPPDVNAVFDHGKRDVSRFPIATGTYYKVDYSAGVDISRYKNLPVPTSYMAVESKFNFVGGYENDTQGGLLHVADHHVSPGKKQWTWGKGDFGCAWDRNLTDEDGPYIELMCGVYTDNQPDFTWLMPFEEKSFNQYFMPYRDLGVLKNATKEAMLNLEIDGNIATVKVYTTGEYPGLKIQLFAGKELLLDEVRDASPESSYEKQVSLPFGTEEQDCYLKVCDGKGKVLVDYRPETEEIKPVPDPAEAAKEPAEINSVEQLYLTGLHLEQYRHATYDPTDYYLEALKREPGDIRNNNAMGLWLLRRGQIQKAESYFREAIKTLTQRNPNPYDGEPYYNLGQCLKYQGRLDEAYDAFYKATWNAAWQDSGYFHLAQIATWRSDIAEALNHVERSLIRNYHNHKARHLKIALLRKSGRLDEAKRWIESSLEIDKFNMGARYENALIEDGENRENILKELKTLMRGQVHNYLEFALDYAAAGLFREATSFLNLLKDEGESGYPMVEYFLGWFASQDGEKEVAEAAFKKAAICAPDYCFPNRLEEVVALQAAMELNPGDALAPYYLGNFWYAARQYKEAMDCWERSRDLNGDFPTVRRNLALAYYNKIGDKAVAIRELEKAFSLNPKDSRILMELDQLYKKMRKPASFRLQFLEEHLPSVEDRDDLFLERITLYNQLGQHERALDLLMNRQFHPWEGGEGKVTGQYLLSRIELGKKAFDGGLFEEAITHLFEAKSFPHNLGEGKLAGAQDNDIDYWLGCAYEVKGNLSKATEYWDKASCGLSEPSVAMFYNDQQPDKIFYQGLALLKLERKAESLGRFNKLVDYGEKHLFDKVKIDYFAVSLPDLLIWEEDLNVRNEIHCCYLIALGSLGLGHRERAEKEFKKVLDLDVYHLGALFHLQMCQEKHISCFCE